MYKYCKKHGLKGCVGCNHKNCECDRVSCCCVEEDFARRSHNLKTNHARVVALALAKNMREYFRDTTHGNVARTYKYLDAETEFIEYIPPAEVVISRNGITGEIRVTPSIKYHSRCEIGCDNSTHREF